MARLSWPRLLFKYQDGDANPWTVTHLSSNRARRIATKVYIDRDQRSTLPNRHQYKQECVSSFEDRPRANRMHQKHAVCSYDLDLDPMTFISEPDLDTVKMLRTKMNFLGQGFQKLKHYRQTDKQTDRQTRPNTLPCRIRWWIIIQIMSWVFVERHAGW